MGVRIGRWSKASTLLLGMAMLAACGPQNQDPLISEALRPLPEDLRADATVYRYNVASGERERYCERVAITSNAYPGRTTDSRGVTRPLRLLGGICVLGLSRRACRQKKLRTGLLPLKLRGVFPHQLLVR